MNLDAKENCSNKLSPRKNDRNFDDLKDLFQERIYGTIKGNYRLDMTLNDLETQLAGYPNQSDLVGLDIGGGLGQITLSLAKNKMFDQIYYYDISSEMKCHVDVMIQAEREKNTLLSPITTKVGGLQAAIGDLIVGRTEISPVANGPDVVCLHAVLEWLSDPIEDLKLLLKFMKPGAILSLLYYNAIASKKSTTAKARKKPRKPSKLTPYHEFDQAEIEAILTEGGFDTKIRTGLRIRKFKRDGNEEELNAYLDEEKKIARVEPFCRQGRYNHLIAIKR